VTPTVVIGTVTGTTIPVSISGATDPDGDDVTVYIWAASDLDDLGWAGSADRLLQVSGNEFLANASDSAGTDDIPDHYPVTITAGSGSETIRGLTAGTDYKVVAISFDGKVGSEFSITDVTTP
jgi:hypothetical protein